MTDKKIDILEPAYPGFPAALTRIKNVPKRLYYLGDLSLLSRRCVAIVGSRTTTGYGRNTAKAIARDLAGRGVTVVSGMASGIDACAHEGALSCGGGTVAVLGCGPDICYPASNHALMGAIAGKGLILSEYPPGTPADPWNFPQRNRIISGLSEMTIVVQARDRSGAMITAELAAEQGRQVMAVPGNIDSRFHLGTNKLIQEGVDPIIRIEDAAEALGLGKVMAEDVRLKLSPREQEIFALISDRGEMRLDDICLQLEKSPQYVNPILSVMEMKGVVSSSMGKFFLANIT